jgi:hypothetical protein
MQKKYILRPCGIGLTDTTVSVFTFIGVNKIVCAIIAVCNICCY